MNSLAPTRRGHARRAGVFAMLALGCGLGLSGRLARAQVDHFEFAPIASPQHVSGLFPSLVPFGVSVTARGSNGSLVPFNGEVALTEIVNGVPDYTFTFEEGNLNGWTRLNANSTYAVTSLDVNGDGRDSLALDMRLNYGTGYGISRQVHLQGGVPYTFSIGSALRTDQDVFYGGPLVRWSLQVEGNIVASEQLGLGYIFANLTLSVGLSGLYVPPSNGLYSIAFVFECPFAETHMHIYADDFRAGYSSLSPPSIALVNGQGSVNVTADRPVTNLVLRATDAAAHFGDSNPFDILPTANLNLHTFIPSPPRAGEDLVLQDLIYNFGPSTATGVKLTNVPPAGMTFVSAVPSQGDCTNIGGVIYCDLGSMPGNNSYVEVLVTLRTATPGAYTNVAGIGGNEFDPDSFYTASERVTVIPVAHPFVEASGLAAVESSGAVRFDLHLRGPSTEGFVVPYSTSNLTASAGLDYTPVTGQVEFAPGVTNQEVLVALLDDVLDEADETIALHFSSPTQEGVAVAVILDDDPLPAISVLDLSSAEGGFGTNELLVSLNLSQPSGREISVRYATADGTATAGSDYLARSGVVSLPAGVTNASLALSVRGNTVNEPDEFFLVTLSQPTNATVAGGAATVTILNDDAVPGQFEHFEWSPILSPQATNRPVAVAATARDAFNNPVTSFNGLVPLTVFRRVGNVTNTIPPALGLSFSNGVGGLSLVVTGAFTNVFCRLDDGLDHVADSNPFEVLSLLPLAVTLPATATEGDGVLAGWINLVHADDRDVLVALQSSDTAEIQVPPGVLIPAGQTNVTFEVTVVDDGDFDGSHPATITATAPFHANAGAAITVQDNETGLLTVTLPSGLREATAVPGPGRVAMNVAAAKPVPIALGSSDTTELIVPGFVTIAAGQTSATFNVTIVDDNLIDGPQPVTITAHVQNWTDGSALTAVEDNESTNLLVEYVFQGPFQEGRGTITNGLRARLNGIATSNVMVNLLSSDTSELLVPASLVIAAGQSWSIFPLTVVDDLETDGPQPVTVTGAAPGFAGGSLSFTVLDNDVHHFDFVPFANGNRTSTVPFSITLSAKDVAGTTILSYLGAVQLGASGDLGFVALQPTNVTNFVRGSWSGLVVITNGAHTNVRLIAGDGLGHAGQSQPFTVHAPAAQQTRLLHAWILGPDVQLQFNTILDRHYRVEATPSLTNAVWTTVISDAVGTGGPVTVTDEGGAQSGQRFYRVALQP